jgi:putative transposase
MILINTILQYVFSTPSSLMRVVDLNHHHDCIVLFDIKSEKALPQIRRLSEIQEHLDNGQIHVIVPDPYNAIIYVQEKELNKRDIEIRNHAYEIISWMINEDKWGLYSRVSRAALIEKASIRFNTTEKTILKYFRKYLQRGMIPNGLLPDFAMCGAPGKAKKSIKRLGRPSALEIAEGERSGLVRTPELEELCHAYYDKYVLKERMSKERAYTRLLKEQYAAEFTYDDNGRSTYLLSPRGSYPTKDVFIYWGEKDVTRTERVKAKYGKDYNLKVRPLLSKATALTTGGPGHLQIDATVGDILLRSVLNKHRLVGKPVIYLVRDTWSGMIVGFACTLEGPSWEGARLALASVFEDKVSLCDRYGLIIKPEDWPFHYRPTKILADRGELLGENPYIAALGLKLEISNTPPYRGDYKPLVEHSFNTLNNEVIHWAPGTTYSREGRTGHDFRNDDKLNIFQVSRMILENIIHRNNFHIKKDFQPEVGMIEDGVLRFSRDILKWGLENKSGALSVVDAEAVRLALLPRIDGSISRHGAYVNKIWYAINDPRLQEFVHKKPEASQAVQISHDPTCIDTIRVHLDPNDEGILCPLRLDFQGYKKATLLEYRDHLTRQSQAEQEKLHAINTEKVNHRAQFEQITNEVQIEGDGPVEDETVRQARRAENAALQKTLHGHDSPTHANQESSQENDDYRPSFNLSQEIAKTIKPKESTE